MSIRAFVCVRGGPYIVGECVTWRPQIRAGFRTAPRLGSYGTPLYLVCLSGFAVTQARPLIEPLGRSDMVASIFYGLWPAAAMAEGPLSIRRRVARLCAASPATAPSRAASCRVPSPAVPFAWPDSRPASLFAMCRGTGAPLTSLPTTPTACPHRALPASMPTRPRPQRRPRWRSACAWALVRPHSAATRPS